MGEEERRKEIRDLIWRETIKTMWTIIICLLVVCFTATMAHFFVEWYKQ
jgi:hypothetical protein